MFNLKAESGGITLTSGRQTVRVVPLKHNIFRVLVTEKEAFSGAESFIVTAKEEIADFSLTQEANLFLIQSQNYTLKFNKETAAISIENANKKTIYRERETNSKQLVEFDSYVNVFDHYSDSAVSESVDGVRADSDCFHAVFDKKLYQCKLQFSFSPEEAIYGFGSHEEGFGNLRGKYRELYQQNLKPCVPCFYSTNGYACLFNANCLMSFHDDACGSYVWLDAVHELDYYIICGDTFDETVFGYRYLTGPAPMLPKWAFGYIQSKERYTNAAELLAVSEEYQKRDVPLDCIVLDWMSWNTEGGWGQKTLDEVRFPNPGEMIEELHRRNTKFMISIWPIMTSNCPNQIQMKQQGCMLGNGSTYNAFSETARKLYWKQANEGLFKHGVDAWWCDCTEPFENDWGGRIKPEPHERVIKNTAFAKKFIPNENISAYSLLHSKGIYEGQRSVTLKKRVVNLTRSSYAGQHRYSTITWAGDTSASWETLKKHIPEGINFCASGEPYWTIDIGGFFVKEKDPWFYKGEYEGGCQDLGYRELYTRWLAYATFLPIFRSHGTDTPREIWRFGEKGTLFYDAIEKFIKLRYQLLPYIYSLAGMVTHKHYTIIRALAFDFKDEEVKKIDHQYMFGSVLMVCPITRPMYYTKNSTPIQNPDKTQTVYLPSDADWYDFWTGDFYKGGQYISNEYPIDTIPLFVKAGSILPMSSAVFFAAQQAGRDYELRVYAGANGEFELYDDEEDNYNYETGAYAFTKLSWDDAAQQLTIGKPIGGYADRVHRTYHIAVINKEPEK